jgi:hypothetical protein
MLLLYFRFQFHLLHHLIIIPRHTRLLLIHLLPHHILHFQKKSNSLQNSLISIFPPKTFLLIEPTNKIIYHFLFCEDLFLLSYQNLAEQPTESKYLQILLSKSNLNVISSISFSLSIYLPIREIPPQASILFS